MTAEIPLYDDDDERTAPCLFTGNKLKNINKTWEEKLVKTQNILYAETLDPVG